MKRFREWMNGPVTYEALTVGFFIIAFGAPMLLLLLLTILF